MSTRAEVNTLFRVLFRDLLGLPDNSIRPANQNAPTGKTLFGTVNITAMDGAQWATRKLENDPDSVDLLETVHKDVTVTLSVQFFHAGAFDTLARLIHLLQSSGGIDRMQEIGAGLQTIGPVRDLTALVDTFFEERAQVDMTFSINAVYVLNIRSILSAKFDFYFEDGFSQSINMEFTQ